MVSVSEALHWVDIHKFAFFFIWDIHTTNRHLCYTSDFSYPSHIPVNFFNVLHTQITFCIAFETSTFYFFYARHNVPLVHASEDLVNPRTCLYLKTLVELKDFSVSKANLYTCLTFCVFVTLSFPDKQVRLIFLSDIHRNNTICDTHPSSKS